jgi:hypothetical protein
VVVEPAVRVVRRIARPSHLHTDDQLRKQRDVVGLETSSVADIRIVGGIAGPMQVVHYSSFGWLRRNRLGGHGNFPTH